MRNVTVTLAVGIVLLGAVGALTLTRAPPRVVRVGVRDERIGLDTTTGDIAVCQTNEALPAGVSGIRLSLWAFFGAQVHVVAYSGSQVLTEGRRGADWTSDSVTVPVRPLDRSSTQVKLCFTIGPNSEPVILRGTSVRLAREAAVLTDITPTAEVAAGEKRLLEGRVGVEYLAAGRGSWWSRVLSVARRVGLGRAFSGTWIALLIAALMAAVGVLAVRLTLRELP